MADPAPDPKPKRARGPRLSRTESQEKTRERLIVTAKKLFLDRGYEKTSIDEVANAAGFSKGAVYSNFGSKEDLCLAVLDAYRALETSSIVKAWSMAGSFEDRVRAFEQWAERMVGDEGWTLLEVEFALHARKNPKLRRTLERARRTETEVIATIIEGQAREIGAELPMRADVAAQALLSLGIGLGVQRVVDHSLSIEPLLLMIRSLFVVRSKKTK